MVLSPKLLTQLQQIVGEDRVLTDPLDLQHYGVDRTRLWEVNPLAVVLPGSTEQVQQLVILANRERIDIVPSGGRTGLSGGAVASHGELVIAMDKMNRVFDINTTEGTLHCEAGVITQHVQEAAAEQGMFYPVDFASSGSSQIGGNIATNAGGVGVMRYGMTRDWVRGLTVVTGKGELLTLNQGLVKNNSGYDFRHLFTGSEGTLGVICEAILALTTPPKNPQVILLGLPDTESIPVIFSQFQATLPLTACEFFSNAALEKVLTHQHSRAPFSHSAPYYLLLEYEQPDQSTPDKALALFEKALANKWVLDGVLSGSEKQSRQLWQLREDISEVLHPWQPYKNDIAVMPSKMPEFMADADKLIAAQHPDFQVIWFGHAGDGNMHLNILKPDSLDLTDFSRQCQALSLHIAALVKRYGGSISAEHGIGLLKKQYLKYSRSEQDVVLMQQVKKVFDPNGIMNPGKLLEMTCKPE